MNDDFDGFVALRALVREYEDCRISFQEYRRRRKDMLDWLDERHNGTGAPTSEGPEGQSGQETIFAKVGDFIKGLKG